MVLEYTVMECLMLAGVMYGFEEASDLAEVGAAVGVEAEAD
jgi:hypothetical protein